MTRPLVLITGGAEFLGGNLCRLLLARGYSVRSLDITAFNHPERDRVDVMLVDVRDQRIVDLAMRGVSFVVHAASAPASSNAEEIYSTGVNGTWTVLRTAVRRHVARFVYLSSTTVYGAQTHGLMNESDPLQGTGPRAEAYIDAEYMCQQARLIGSNISILRLTDCVGPEPGDTLRKLYDFARVGRHFPVLGRGCDAYQLLDIEDVCEAICLCLSMRGDLVNDIFNLGSSGPATLRESFQAVLDRAGHGKRILPIPTLAAVVLGLLRRLPGGSALQWLRDTADRKSHVSVRHIGVRLGFRPRYSTRDALLRNYEAYLCEHPKEGVRNDVATSRATMWMKAS